MINLNLLNTFFHVARLGSFSRAADAMDLSKAIVSRHIKELESVYNTQLMRRTTRSLQLTTEGEYVYQQCLEIMESVATVDDYLGESQNQVSGNLRLKIPPVLDYPVFYDILQEYQKNYPEVTVNIELADRLGNAQDENFDLALHIGHIRDCSYACRIIRRMSTFVVATPEYWDANGKPEHPADLSRYTCLNYSHCKSKGRWLFYKNGVQTEAVLNSKIESDSEKMLMHLVLRNMGVTTVLDILAEPYLGSGELEPVLEDYTFPVDLYALYPSRKHIPARVKAFIELLEKRLSAPNHHRQGRYL